MPWGKKKEKKNQQGTILYLWFSQIFIEKINFEKRRSPAYKKFLVFISNKQSTVYDILIDSSHLSHIAFQNKPAKFLSDSIFSRIKE